MSYIIDIIIVAIVLISVIIFAKKGFVGAAVQVAGFVLAFIVATNFGGYLADIIYNKSIEPAVVTAVSDNLNNKIDSNTESFFEALPDFIKKNGSAIGITPDTFKGIITKEVFNNDDITAVLDTTLKPIVLNMLTSLTTLLIFVVLLVCVRFAAKAVNKIFSFSIIGTLNRILGGIIGIPVGVVYSIIFCMLLRLALSFSANGIWIFTADTINSSKLYNLMISVIN